ncbi:putative magnesium transporter [Heracleum sosnowskyi]|uniref:Probable magnesium transporter n=1 Tax=Heracleum sosnowskyi TaxID=360622 RepID=A0AAD8IRI5_9APIA|nr:putative magnesium transporter [Heracleum sosnowskyi]
MGVSKDNAIGLGLAIFSSIFIGSSYIIKKKGLIKAGASGIRAGAGGYSYLKEPMWWFGMMTMLGGEVANFVAYTYAPAVLVTPLGALSIIVSEILAHYILKERLHIIGVVGIILCIDGSVGIVIHAPKERDINSVKELWHLALQPGFIIYFCIVVAAILILVFVVSPSYGQKYLLIYIAVCSLAGSLTVVCVKAVGIALKLFILCSKKMVVLDVLSADTCSPLSDNSNARKVVPAITLSDLFLLLALDTFHTNVVSPVYYVAFTFMTILASMIMLKDWNNASSSQITSAITGFITIICGTFLLHRIKNMTQTPVLGTPIRTSDVNAGSIRGFRALEQNTDSSTGFRTLEVNTVNTSDFRTPDVKIDIVRNIKIAEANTDITRGALRTP